MPKTALNSEIERQEKCLKNLPDDFTYPLFNAREALESQRRSGYRDTAAATRELVDNALEAGADRVDVVFETGKPRGKQAVTSVAVIDNGSGMLPQMARFALTWGGGTHFEDHEFIGRFGFGLPNASINQTRLVEVYTKTAPKEPITKAWLDITKFAAHGIQEIPEPEEASLPKFVERYLEKNDLTFDRGTVVVWVNPDRLSYRTPVNLAEHLIDDFGVTYRYLLGCEATGRKGLDLIIERKKVEPIDPLFLDPCGRLYLPPDEGGAQLMDELSLVLRLDRDATTGEDHLSLIEDPEGLKNTDDAEAVGTVHLKVARFPVGFVEGTKEKGKETTDAHRRFEIRKTRRGVSFVRAGREIQTVDAFPRSQQDIASGLGQWPLLQSFAYHWGMEIKFGPELDDAFGITNDKQSVRPMEDFWRILHDKEVDAALRRENQWQHKERKNPPRLEESDEPSLAEVSAQAADMALSERPQTPPRAREQARDELDRAAKKRKKKAGGSLDEAREAIEKETKRRPYRVEYADLGPQAPFYEPAWAGAQMVARINRDHAFYKVVYGDVLNVRGGARAKEAIDLLLIALTRAELTVEHEEMAVWYETQRVHQWSTFLAAAIKTLAQKSPKAEEEDAEAA